MIGVLCSNIYNETSTDNIQEASLEALGYICQDIVSVRKFCRIYCQNSVSTAFVFCSGLRMYNLAFQQRFNCDCAWYA